MEESVQQPPLPPDPASRADEAPTPSPVPVVCFVFWKRILAFLLDVLVLGIVGWVLTLFLLPLFIQLGAWGRCFGFAVAFLYFGILNSALGGGATFGKRLAGIRVVDRQGNPLPLARSLLRYLLLGIPYFLNGALIPSRIMRSPLGFLISLVIFGSLVALLYLFVFNRRTRQALHDLAAGSFVIRRQACGQPITQAIWRGHLFVAAFLIACVLLCITALGLKLSQNPVMAELLATQRAIENLEQVQAASAMLNKTFSIGSQGSRKISFYMTNAIWKAAPDNYEKAANQVAAIVLARFPRVMQQDLMVIKITHGFDIGIASGWSWCQASFTPQEWKKRMQ